MSWVGNPGSNCSKSDTECQMNYSSSTGAKLYGVLTVPSLIAVYSIVVYFMFFHCSNRVLREITEGEDP